MRSTPITRQMVTCAALATSWGVRTLRNNLSAILTTTISSTLFQLLAVLLVSTFYTVLERKGLGAAQRRIGPSQSGPQGLAQVAADGGKLVVKGMHRTSQTWSLAVIAVTFCMVAFSYVVAEPLGYVVTSELSVVASYLALSMAHLGIVGAGIATLGYWARTAARRASVITILAEPLLVTAYLAATTCKYTLAHLAQAPMNILDLAPLLMLLLSAGLLEQGRIPVDLQEAESELIGGFNTEYGGLQYALLACAEYGIVLVSATGIVLLAFPAMTLGAMVSKVTLLFLLLVILRATLPRYSMGSISTGWKGYLVPLACTALILR